VPTKSKKKNPTQNTRSLARYIQIIERRRTRGDDDGKAANTLNSRWELKKKAQNINKIAQVERWRGKETK
jgi:hypothetical protein